MSRAKTFLKYWLPVILWMALIFGASGYTRSSQRSSRIIEPIVRWLFPHISEPAMDATVFFIRKCAHVTEYAVFALLLWRAIRKPARDRPQPWRRSQVSLVIGLAFLYAATDEIHQLFVPSREGKFHDVVIDTLGAALGLFALWLFGKWRMRRQSRATGRGVHTASPAAE